MRCPYCGADNNNSAEYCNYCNSYIKKEEPKPNTVVNQTIYINNNADKSREDNIDYQAVTYEPQKKKHKLSKKVVIFLIIAGVLMVVGLISQNQNKKNNNSQNNSVWTTEYADINDFDFYIDGNELFIGRYKGREKKIKISSVYTIDEKDVNVVGFNDGTFFCRGVQSVIIPEGTKTLASNTFNSSRVKFVYLPKTLEKLDDTFWGYFHDMEKIYYGGSEEHWNEICAVNRDKIDCKEIVYNTDISELK